MSKVKKFAIIVPIVIVLYISSIYLLLQSSEVNFDGLVQAANVGQYQGLSIQEIEIIGNNDLTEEDVLKDIGLKIGDKFDSDIINKAITKMFSNSKYERVAIDVEKIEGNNLILKVIIAEQPTIKSIYFNGNKKLNAGILEDTIEPYLKEGGTYAPQNLNDAANAIISNYQSKGYLKVYVSPKVKEDKKNSSVDIDFNIEEGQEIQVSEIRFFGNTKYSSKTLEKQMSTKVRGLFSFGKFDEFKFKVDLDSVALYYRDRGYYYAEVTDIRYTYKWKDPNKKDVQYLVIDVYIKEGDQYKFGLIDIKGNIIIPSAELFKGINSKKGTLYNYTTFYTDYTKLQAVYSERGYIFRQVIPIVKVDEDNRTVNITYDIIENDRAHIESIGITGNTKTKDFIIERYIDIEPGEIFNSQKIQRIQERLFNTQFFNNINIGVKPGTVEGLMDLTFEIEEGKTAMVSGGGGFSTSSGLSIFAELKEMNFLGRGLQVGISGEFGEDLKRAGVNFVEPYIFQLPIYFGFDFSYFHENVNTGVDLGTVDNLGFTEYSYYTRQGIEVLFRVGHYFLDYYSTFLTFDTIFQQYQQSAKQGATEAGPVNVPIDVADQLTKPVFKDGFKRLEGDWNTTFILSYTILRDSRNNYLNPTRGWYARYDVDFFFGFNELSKQTLTGFVAIPFFFGSSFALYGEFGQILDGMTGKIKNDSDVLYNLNPFEDIRGWNGDLYTVFKLNRGLSTYTFADGFLTSYGRTKIRLFFEYRIPIIKDVLGFTAFLDIGQLWLPYPTVKTINGINEFTYAANFIDVKSLFDPSQYIYSVGVGLRLTVPIFNIRLYAAKRFVYNKYDVGLGKGFQDFETDGYTFLGEWFGRGWEVVFSMNHPFY